MTELDTIKAAVKEAMKEEMQAFYIDREEHYQHHQFIKGLKSGVDSCQSIIGRVSLVTVIGGVTVVLILGVVAWIKKSLGLG